MSVIFRIFNIVNAFFKFEDQSENVRDMKQEVIQFMERDVQLQEHLACTYAFANKDWIESIRLECSALLTDFLLDRVVSSSHNSAIKRCANYAAIKGTNVQIRAKGAAITTH